MGRQGWHREGGKKLGSNLQHEGTARGPDYINGEEAA